MTDAEINEAVARALGYVPYFAFGERQRWQWVAPAPTSPDGSTCDVCVIVRECDMPDWATSLDACFRDLVPEAEERGWTLAITRDSFEGLSSWSVDFDDEVGPGGIEGAGSESPSRALCLAWLKTKEAP